MNSRRPVAATIGGFEYQHLVALNEVLKALLPTSDVVAIEVEARDAGNVDDVVVRRRTEPSRFLQCKHAVGGDSPVGTEYLTVPQGKRSLLQRFYSSWQELSADGAVPEMLLVTDREVDPNDVVAATLDHDTGLIMPDIASGGPRSNNGRARRVWAEHVGATEDELLSMLEHLSFETGRSEAVFRELAQSRLLALGLEATPDDVGRGVEVIREWTRSRDGELTVGELRDRIFGAIPTASPPVEAIVAVEALYRAPSGDDPTVRVDFTTLFADDDDERRQLERPEEWNDVVWPELVAAADQIGGGCRVLVRGPMRQAMQFAAGASLSMVRGFEVVYPQGAQLWDVADAGAAVNPAVTPRRIGPGADLAVAVAITQDPTAPITAYLEREVPAVGHLAVLTPAGGIGDRALVDGRAANDFAQGVRNVVRDLVAQHDAQHVYLFLVGPGGLAVLLGSRWNVLVPTTVHEHVGGAQGYIQAMTVPAATLRR